MKTRGSQLSPYNSVLMLYELTLRTCKFTVAIPLDFPMAAKNKIKKCKRIK